MKTFVSSNWGLLSLLVWCLFMGVTAISIGVGALYPPMNIVAKPFVCLNGEMRFEQATSNPLPGTTYTTTAWYCIRNGDKSELPIFPMALYSGLIYGLVLFVVIEGAKRWQRRGQPSVAPASPARPWSQPAGSDDFSPSRPNPQATPGDSEAARRMHELNDLRAANLISEDEYQQKRAEIIKKL